MNSVITLDRIDKYFGNKQVLKEISLNVDEGQVFGLIGPSGSGKTTLVKMIVGMDTPSKGDIHVLNKKVPNLELLQLIGYMAQSDALYSELTGAENLDFFASLFHLSKKIKKERISYAADLVDLSSDLSKRVSSYSGGMKRRLSLAIALLHDPKILILDEPTVGIDPQLRLTIWNELLRLKKEEAKTIIITTHVMDEAERCDSLAMVREGQIISAGSPRELKAYYTANNLEEVFLKAGGGIHENSSLN